VSLPEIRFVRGSAVPKILIYFFKMANGLILFTSVGHNTLVHELDIHKGSQWALHNARLSADTRTKETLAIILNLESTLGEYYPHFR